MALEPYKDKTWLYEHYVKKRMNLTDIVKLLKQTYNVEISPQGLYNWCSKYDLLKFRGKGRNLSGSGAKRAKSEAQLNAEKRKREMAKRSKHEKKMRGR